MAAVTDSKHARSARELLRPCESDRSADVEAIASTCRKVGDLQRWPFLLSRKLPSECPGMIAWNDECLEEKGPTREPCHVIGFSV